MTRTEIHALAERIAAEFRPEKVILFGSHAYGTPSEDSDVDMLVIMDVTRVREKNLNEKEVRYFWKNKYVRFFQGSRTSQDTEDWVNQYDELLRAIDPKAPPAAVLFAFMFDSPDVPADVTKESEAILTKVMGENRTWAWAEVDLPMIRPGMSEQSIMGAIGIDFDNPREISILRLNQVHDRWKPDQRANASVDSDIEMLA